MDDDDFIQACENADSVAKRMYREEAKAIEQLQQDILTIVNNEDPYGTIESSDSYKYLLYDIHEIYELIDNGIPQIPQ